MSRFINILVGWIAFTGIIVLGRAGAALAGRNPQQIIQRKDYIFLAVVVASMFFLQYAIERYILPPAAFTKDRRKTLLEGAQEFYRKTFFRGAIGISYFFLILYVWDFLNPIQLTVEKARNWIAYSAFFLVLGMLARARGIIFHLSQQTSPPAGILNSPPVT